jgi:hypothetical protein
MPEVGKRVRLLCQLETEGVYDPKEGQDWFQLPDQPSKALVTHWSELPEEVKSEVIHGEIV